MDLIDSHGLLPLCHADGFEADLGFAFDPVRQKSLADSAFDLGVAGFFGDEPQKQQHQEYEEEEEDEGPVDDEDDDGSVGDGYGFEVQDEHFTDEGARGAMYEVVFNAPTQFGMLLEVSFG
jgi:hypothetical protein